MYFESFEVLTLTVKILDLGGQSKLKLIESTVKIIESSEFSYDEVWCVFDMDAKGERKERSEFDNAIVKGKEKGFKIAYSNDCFELWFYLHYNFTDSRNHRQFYYQELSKNWSCNYEKDGKRYKFSKSIYQKLQNDPSASQKEAIKRAKKLYKDCNNKKYHMQNPVTKVYELVEFLNENLRS